MARIRSIHPGLFTDEAFVTVSIAARLLFVGLLTECDDNGVFEWKPLTLKMRVYPADNIDVPSLLSELSDANIVRSFAVSEKSFGAIRNFRKWQRPKSPLIIHPITAEIHTFVASEAAEKREDQQGKRGTTLGRILLDQQNGSCFYCETDITFYRKKPNSLEIDHKTPISRGGTDDIENLCACCRPCNSLKANMTDREFRDKFAVAELLIRHDRGNSQLAKNSSATAKTGNDLSHPQREDGGGRSNRRKEDSTTKTSVVVVVPPKVSTTTTTEAALQEKVSSGALEPPVHHSDVIGSLIDPAFRPEPDRLGRCKADGATEAQIEQEIELFIAYNRDHATFSADWDSTWVRWWARWRARQSKEPKAPPRIEVNATPDWDMFAKMWATIGKWPSHGAGGEPGMKSCRCPPDVLQRYGINPETGLKISARERA